MHRQPYAPVQSQHTFAVALLTSLLLHQEHCRQDHLESHCQFDGYLRAGLTSANQTPLQRQSHTFCRTQGASGASAKNLGTMCCACPITQAKCSFRLQTILPSCICGNV